MKDITELTDEEEVRLAKADIRLDIAKQEAMGIKVTRYDSELNCFYVINDDESKTITQQNVRKESYS